LLANYITVEDRRANFKQHMPQIMKAMDKNKHNLVNTINIKRENLEIKSPLEAKEGEALAL